MPSEAVRVHIRVFGRVQGVGFRAYVLDAFADWKLTGWVRNVGYDQVEAVAEGPRTDLELFAEAVQRGPRAARVDRFQVDWEAASGEFARAEVR